MELDLQRFYNINRRIVMWIVFFLILYLLRHFFTVMFLTFIFGFVMRKVAKFVTSTTQGPYWAAVVFPYLLAVGLLVLLMVKAIPRVVDECVEFSRSVPQVLETLADEIKKTAHDYGMDKVLARYVNADVHGPHLAEENRTIAELVPASRPAVDSIDTNTVVNKIQDLILGFLPGAGGEDQQAALPNLFLKFAVGVVSGTLQFLLAILLSFLIVLDFEGIAKELRNWRKSPVGRFFHEAAASVMEFSEMVGTAFQCQMLVALLNATITCIGMVILGIQPLLLLTTIVFLFGLIPVLGVFISSVPIILIAFNDSGLSYALIALGIIFIVHLLEAYVFNPRIYAARFHLNPVIVLIILLVAHKLFGIWGMLLGIPVTHYVLNIAQMPSMPRMRRYRKIAEVKK